MCETLTLFDFLMRLGLNEFNGLLCSCFEERMETTERNGKVGNSNQKEVDVVYSLGKRGNALTK